MDETKHRPNAIDTSQPSSEKQSDQNDKLHEL